MSAPSLSLSRNLMRLLSTAAIFMPAARNRLYSTSPPSPTFTYRLAAASIGKTTSPRPPKVNRDFWNYASTHPSPEPPYLRSTKPDAGEDAFFVTTVGGSPNSVALGIADGVGGWQEQGIDPSKFSHGLCGLMAGTAYTYEGREPLKPRDLLQTAYDAVMSNPHIPAGGSTACLAVLGPNGAVEAANLGDSGFLILGPGKVTARSEIQTHAFNTPYQLAKIPQRMQAQYAIFGDSAQQHSERPANSDVTRHRLNHGDIMLFATDGVWDNLSAQDTLAIVTRVMEEEQMWFRSHNFAGAETMLNASGIRMLPRKVEQDVQETFLPGRIASAVMREAKLAGLDRRRSGPFAKEVKRAYPNEPWEGGKPDDVAVLVAVAVEEVEDAPVKAKL